MAVVHVIQKINPRTDRGNKWGLIAEHSDGSRTTLGFHPTKSAAKVVASLLAGWRGKVEVRKTPERVDAWRIDVC